MRQAENNLYFDLWRTARTLWIEYCGIADEYKMMRDRWLYLHGENKLMVLPYLRHDNNEEKKTFDRVNDHTNDLERDFKSIGFERTTMENFSNFEDSVRDMGRDNLIGMIAHLELGFFDLSNFVGFLKSAFFQRTVSAEIQHVVSGLSHSPERTIGNELFFLAADKVAQSYCNCLNIPYWMWDGFITFIPPIEGECFYGGFYKVNLYLDLFHVSMSEEAKYFVGRYLTLAHEFGHSVMEKKYEENGRLKLKITPLIDSLVCRISENTEYLVDKKNVEFRKNCPIYRCINDKSSIENVIIELIADIIAVYIGGLNYLHQFIDSNYSLIFFPEHQSPFLLRLISSYYYLKLNDFEVLDLKVRTDKLLEDAKKIRETHRCYCPSEPDFYECIPEICALWAKNINEFNIEEALFSKLVKADHVLKLGEKEKNKIKKALREGRPIPEKNPREILHCFYDLYKESDGEKRPNFTATIYSLAFNKGF